MKILQIIIFTFLSGLTFAQGFETNMEESRNLAAEEGKLILMVFSGSDWCKPCIQLKEHILLSEEFLNYSKNNLVLLNLDFPYKKKNQLTKEQTTHNEYLASKYNEEGSFPKVLLMNSNQEVLSKIDFKKNMSSEDFIAQIEKNI